MKYLILIGDGMADLPLPERGGRTPLEIAETPNMDWFASKGALGLARTVPEGYPPGSDVANLSILGYDPAKYYTGRSPLEAASMGIRLGDNEVSFRCNLVSLAVREGITYMEDYSAGHIGSDEAEELIRSLDSALGETGVRFYPGVSYRHLMVWKGAPDGIKTVPPHDISGRPVTDYLPSGDGSEFLRRLIYSSQKILGDHPVNLKRRLNSLPSADSIWLWGEGRCPVMPAVEERFGISGSIISAVDLMKGIGKYAGLDVVDVPGATGYLGSNLKGKYDYAVRSLQGRDMVCIHVEAPDEAGHMGNTDDKISAIEDFDREIVGPFVERVKLKDISSGSYRFLILCDHPTPLSLKTHTSDPVPFILYPSPYPMNNTGCKYTESEAGKTAFFIKDGYELFKLLICQ